LFSTAVENIRYEVAFDLSLHSIKEVASAICISKADELSGKGIDTSQCDGEVENAIAVFIAVERRNVTV
jgi:hypothetical protein